MVLDIAQSDMTAVTPLPMVPVLSLPSGDVAIQGDGQLFLVRDWVVVVGLSPEVVLVVTERVEPSIPNRLIRELLEYLGTCGKEIIRVEFCCLVDSYPCGSFELLRRLWAGFFLKDRCRWMFSPPMPLSQKAAIILPVATIAEDGAVFWRAAGAVADAMLSGRNSSDALFRRRLAHIARVWETRWAQILAQLPATANDDDPCHWLPRCEKAWARVVRNHLAPYGYRTQPVSTATML